MPMTRLNKYSVYPTVGLVLLCSVCVVIVIARKHAGEPRTNAQGGSTAKGRTRTFRLKEVSAFDLTEQTREFGEGQRAVCRDKPDPNVRAYPTFGSPQPIYGKVSFADPLGKPDPRTVYHLALDESGGTGQGYDRLYFDLNQDGDLTNDKVLAAQRNPPKGATLNYSDPTPQVCFENLAIPFPFGSQDKRPLEMMPRLLLSRVGSKTLSFVTTKTRQGRIRIAGGKYDVLLGHKFVTAGWFDSPWTGLAIGPAGGKGRLSWQGGDRLNATHNLGGVFYRFSSTPAGDELTVRRYEGPLGVFEAGAGGRSVEGAEISGSLQSETTAVAIGPVTDSGRAEPVRSWKLPVGDYLPENLNVRFGKLSISLSNNYHTDGKRMDTIDRRWVYGIHIREDKPFVFDFSNKPVVMFAGPTRDRRIKPGEELRVMAVLIDPVLDFMIRHLNETTQKQKGSYLQDLSLDPKVTITRASGEIVAEGVMPFG